MAVKMMQKFPSKASRGGNNVDFAAMFRNEIRILSGLSERLLARPMSKNNILLLSAHPNIIAIHEAFEGQSTLYAVRHGVPGLYGGRASDHGTLRRR